MCQSLFKLCTKVSSKMEAFTLGKFRGSIWIGLGETSGSAVFYLDRPSIWKEGLYLNQGLFLDESGFYPDEASYLERFR